MPALEPTLPPTDRLRLSDTVYNQLLGDILEARIAVGERLVPETQLAERFAVSRPVVREALQRLQSDGVVISRQGSGSFFRNADRRSNWARLRAPSHCTMCCKVLSCAWL